MTVELPTTLVTVSTVARYLSVSADWIYEHADELGARRLGTGPRARLRFSLLEVDERLRTCPAGRESQTPAKPENKPSRRRRASGRLGTGGELLPIRGRESAA